MTGTAIAQDLCEVKVLERVGTYAGECRRGIAHDEGTATGTDTYTGENGDVYVGEFHNGRRNGEGPWKLQLNHRP